MPYRDGLSYVDILNCGTGLSIRGHRVQFSPSVRCFTFLQPTSFRFSFSFYSYTFGRFFPFVVPACIHNYGVGGVWVQLLGGQVARARVVLVLRESIWNTPRVSLVSSAFSDTGSLGSTPRQVVYPPASMVPPWVTASIFLCRE